MGSNQNTTRSVLSREQAASNGDPDALPDKLKPMEIAALEYPDDPDGGNARFQFCNALQKAIDRDELKTSGQTNDIYLTSPKATVVPRPLISRANYRQFMELIGADPSPGVASWLDGIGVPAERPPPPSKAGRELVAIKHRPGYEEKALIADEADRLIKRGKLNHVQIAKEIRKQESWQSSANVIREIVKARCTELGRTDLIQGHPDYHKP